MAHLAMVLACVLWSSASVASKGIFDIVPFIELVFLRFFLGALTQWIGVIAMSLRITPGIARRAFLIGLIEPGVIATISNWGLSQTTAVHVVVIFALMPIITAIFAHFFINERLSLSLLLGSVLAIAATALLVARGSDMEGASLVGDITATVAMAMAAAAALVLRRNAQAHVGSAVVLSAVQLSGATIAVGVIFAAVGDSQPLAWLASADASAFAVIAYVGIAVSGSSMALYNFAFRRLEAARVSLYVVLMTPLGVIFAAIFLGERVTWIDAGLIAVIVAGVSLPTMLELTARRKAVPRRSR